MVYSKLNDQELINNYLIGNEFALETLIRRHQRKVFSHIKKLVKERQQAEDIFQDTFFKVVHTLKSGRYNDEGKFLPWVMTIARNLCIDFFRDEKKLPSINQGRGDKSNEEYDHWERLNLCENVTELKIEKSEMGKKLKSLLKLLPADQREIIILRHNLDMSFKEIADHKNISINTALGRMRYALLNIKKLIEERKMVFH